MTNPPPRIRHALPTPARPPLSSPRPVLIRAAPRPPRQKVGCQNERATRAAAANRAEHAARSLCAARAADARAQILGALLRRRGSACREPARRERKERDPDGKLKAHWPRHTALSVSPPLAAPPHSGTPSREGHQTLRPLTYAARARERSCLASPRLTAQPRPSGRVGRCVGGCRV